MFVPLPLSAWGQVTNETTYRMQVLGTVHLLNLDVVRLQHYRDAVKSGFYSDEIKP